MGDISKNFNRAEFACKCGCGFDNIDDRVVGMVQKIRDALGEPVRINSGCRCVEHNERVGGVKNSNHTLGKAADLSTAVGSARLFAVIRKLFADRELKDLKYCEHYTRSNFVHIDCGGTRVTRFRERDK